jgi:hypothetical protein
MRGLNIEHILSPNIVASGVATPRKKVHLDAMLEHYPFPVSTPEESVPVTLVVQPGQPSGTDESIEGEDQGILGIVPLKFASKSSTDRSKILLQSSEVNYNQPPAQITKNLCSKLAKDAFCIANTHKNARTREATTCFCVVVRDSEKCPKKFFVHNSTGEMPLSMREKANNLAYGIRNAHLAHAEAQFVAFLIYRAKQRTQDKNKIQYTHILGMGCSKKYCQECNALCKLFLGNGYPKFTAAVDKLNDEPSMPVIKQLTHAYEADLQMAFPIQNFKVVLQEDAIRDGNNRSPNYRLSARIQAAIRHRSGLIILDFSMPRFNSIGQGSATPLLTPTEDEHMDIAGEHETEETGKENMAEQKIKAASAP